MPEAWHDPSAFFRLNEELAAEVGRLERAGALDRLKELLAAGDSELWVAAVRPRVGLEEAIGVLRPGAPGAELPRGELAPTPLAAPGPCDCGPDAAAPAGASAPATSGWDAAGVLAARSRFTIQTPAGDPVEVYMPDHVCPRCWNDDRNQLASCARACGACGFRW